MTNTYKHAEIEFSVLSASSTDPENRPLVEPFRKEILALCEAFGKSGQSGGSAPYTVGAIKDAIGKLLMQMPICPIMGIPEEWGSVASFSQNKRCSALFKNTDGKSYYLDAIIWKTQNGTTWGGSALLKSNQPDGTDITQKIRSRQYVKSFPFTPKTFIIDVIEEEISKDDWIFHVKDPDQLLEVFEYYDLYSEE